MTGVYNPRHCTVKLDSMSFDRREFGLTPGCKPEPGYPGGDPVIVVTRVPPLTRRDGGEPLNFCSGEYKSLSNQ